jgi:hypothetical protein
MGNNVLDKIVDTRPSQCAMCEVHNRASTLLICKDSVTGGKERSCDILRLSNMNKIADRSVRTSKSYWDIIAGTFAPRANLRSSVLCEKYWPCDKMGTYVRRTGLFTYILICVIKNLHNMSDSISRSIHRTCVAVQFYNPSLFTLQWKAQKGSLCKDTNSLTIHLF